MVAWSSIVLSGARRLNGPLNLIFSSKNALNRKNINCISVRNSGGHEQTFYVRPSLYQTKKFQDLAILYFLLGFIPLALFVTYCNVFIGESELAEIPEGYTPKNYEYYSHPVTRMLAKLIPSQQQVFEINCHRLFEESEKQKIAQLHIKIREKIKERGDYQSWYFRKPQVKYARIQEKQSKEKDWDEIGHLPVYVDEV